MSYLDYIGLEFWKDIVIFQINTHEFVKIEILTHTVIFSIESPF